MTQPKKRRFSSHLKLLLVSSLVAIVIVASKQLNLQEVLRTSLIWVESLGSLAAVAFIVIYNVATVLFIRGTLMTMSGGALFGVFWGSIYVVIAAILGAIWAFLIGRSQLIDRGNLFDET